MARSSGTNIELAMAIAERRIGSADLSSMREKQARLPLEIEALTAEIRRASPKTIEDIVALLDVVLEHETDLAYDIANDDPIDYAMIMRSYARRRAWCQVWNLTPSGDGFRQRSLSNCFLGRRILPSRLNASALASRMRVPGPRFGGYVGKLYNAAAPAGVLSA
jgi:hypothetical protein